MNERKNIRKLKSNKGITLIALVVTIIVLIILAGVSINLVIGDNGIIQKSIETKNKEEEAAAMEKLTLALLDLQTEKATKIEYNQNEYVDQYLFNRNMAVITNIVIVDGWKFQINRDLLKIETNIGKGEESKDIKIETIVQNDVDYAKAKILIEVESQTEIISIQINGEEVEIPEKTDEKYVLEKEVLENGNYIVYVKNKNEEYKIATASITEISENMEIYTIEDMMAFKERVNKGATFTGKTIQLMQDIDLSSVCGEGKRKLGANRRLWN